MVRIVATAEMPVPPERASQLIADPKLVEKWLRNASGIRADDNWPRFDSQLSWALGSRGDDVCEARVVDNHLPDLLKVEVTTPDTNKVVLHKFTRLPNGNTLYEKEVDAEPKGFIRFLGAFGIKKLRAEIEREVKRAAESVTPDPALGPKPRAAKARKTGA